MKKRPSDNGNPQPTSGTRARAPTRFRHDGPGLSLEQALEQAQAFHRTGNWGRAEALYKWMLGAYPGNFDALHYFGILKAQGGLYAEALELIDAALKINSRSAEARLTRGNVLNSLNRVEEAFASYDMALAIRPQYPEALYCRANALQRLNRHEEALANYDTALTIAPDRPELLTNRGNTLHDLRRYEEALTSYDRALALAPGVAMLHNNRGNTLRELKRYEAALASLKKALAIEPGYVDALINCGNVLQDLGRHEEALACIDKALVTNPDHLPALNNRGNVLRDLKRHEEAARTVTRLLELEPNWDYAPGVMFQSQLCSCNWASYAQDTARIFQGVRDRKKADIPFSFLAISESAADQLLCARTYIADKYPPSAAPLWTGPRYHHDRIRLAYLSADLREHVMAYCLLQLFETHDRARFETTAVSFGPDVPGEMRSRLKGAFSRFVDVNRNSDREVAQMLRDLEIDIAVDLHGFTTDCRPGIFANRPAPIQVNYLGFPGTMGADYIDYIVADRFVIPEEHHPHYSEKAAYLPDTYMATDSRRVIADRTPLRSEAGLPERGFVFCSFNNSYKINPAIFDVWMRLLSKVEASVLWLREGDQEAIRNLRGEAARRGVAPERLVFASRTERIEDHLARHRLADLSLDTLPYNAHATTSDALWAGLPVVTCLGTTFAGRVGASLLNAIGLNELITRSLDEYEALALELATNSQRLAAIKSKLAANRDTYPLFDTDRFRRHIEAAYTTMWERYQRGEPPASFTVSK